MAEFVIGGLLVLARRFHLMLAAQRERRWVQNELTRDVWPWSVLGRRMTIVGFGTTGQEVARRAHAFGMRVIGIPGLRISAHSPIEKPRSILLRFNLVIIEPRLRPG